MAVRFVIDKLEDVPQPLREHYTLKDGKYQLTLDGEHPDTSKVADMRSNNIKLLKENDELKAKYHGIDPAAVAANAARLAELEKAKPDVRIAELESALATEKAARATAQATADASVLKSAVTDAFIRTGGRAEATEFMVSKATSLFDVANGVVVGRTFDPNRPGEKLTVDSFISAQLQESAFAFKPSSGGGADPKRGGGQAGGKRLINPTPQELGANSSAIARGEIKVEYTT
jgi:hypothetical protein